MEEDVTGTGATEALEGAAEGGEAAVEGAANGAEAAADAVAAGGSSWFDMVPLIDKGGPIVVILIILSVLSLAIILLKIVQFWRAGLSRRAFIDPAIEMAGAGDLEGAAGTLRKHRSPIARVMLAGVQAKQTGLEPSEEMGRVGGNELGALQGYFRWLEVIGNISPLLGLLGTVIGMIEAFQQLEAAGNRVDPAILSGGIWEALLTTAVGLAVAIPAIGALNLFENKVDLVRLNMRDATSRMLAALRKA
ncbi:MotA/TolQ/ExbB proton channel family protein [Tepidicaulis sp. LMO-SS28]|uniref:MotA/TolQ/ExbB proton channel family protein n=1 Tax=Tepidicaulis sp. LMO-SS28 TaxID=3447455 RepID=UPI003EE40FB4